METKILKKLYFSQLAPVVTGKPFCTADYQPNNSRVLKTGTKNPSTMSQNADPAKCCFQIHQQPFEMCIRVHACSCDLLVPGLIAQQTVLQYRYTVVCCV